MPDSPSKVDRRRARRWRLIEAPRLRKVRLKDGPDVDILDVSASGILFRTDNDMAADKNVVLEIVTVDGSTLEPARVVWSRRMTSSSFVWYEIGCALRRPDALRDLIRK
jgi:hypothetical protein